MLNTHNHPRILCNTHKIIFLQNECLQFLYDAPCCFALSVVPVRTQTTRYSGLSNSSRWGVDVGTELALQSKKSKFSPTRKIRCCRVFCSVTNVNTAHVSVSHPGRSTSRAHNLLQLEDPATTSCSLASCASNSAYTHVWSNPVRSCELC